MPAEKFYPSTAIEGQPSDHLEIKWHGNNPGVQILIEVDGLGATWFADRSAINRMIRSLRRARDATFGADE